MVFLLAIVSEVKVRLLDLLGAVSFMFMDVGLVLLWVLVESHSLFIRGSFVTFVIVVVLLVVHHLRRIHIPVPYTLLKKPLRLLLLLTMPQVQFLLLLCVLFITRAFIPLKILTILIHILLGLYPLWVVFSLLPLTIEFSLFLLKQV